MKKVSKILYLVAGILAFVGIITAIYNGIKGIIKMSDDITNFVNNMIRIHVIPEDATEEQIMSVRALAQVFLTISVVWSFLTIFPSIALGILGMFGYNDKLHKPGYIVCMVLGFLFGCPLMIPAGILALIADKKAKEEPKEESPIIEEQPKVIEVKQEEVSK